MHSCEIVKVKDDYLINWSIGQLNLLTNDQIGNLLSVMDAVKHTKYLPKVIEELEKR